MNTNFINLSDYCVLEYRLTPVDDPGSELLTSDFYVLTNAHTESRQIYNTDGYRSITNNSRDLSIVSVGGSKAVYIDPTLSPIYTEFDPLLTQTAVPQVASTNLVMDTVRVHFASGFNFTEVENVIFGVKQTLNDLSQLQLANILLDSVTAQEIFTYNTQPLFLANTIYDKYVELKIPSIPKLNADFAQFGAASFEHIITGGVGFIKGAPITVFFAEAVYEEYNAPNNITYDRYQINNYSEGAISQNNKFNGLGCHIIEATDGDYIEFFATWNQAFPDSLIASLNESGVDQDWILSHQLQVYEQLGSNFIQAGNLIVYQEDNFDLPLSYRPILRNAGFAISMSIDYTLRLLNRKTGEQVIRTGALSVINPNKYGRSLAKLTLLDSPQSMKVYNKIVQKNFEIGSIFSPKSAQVNVKTQSLGLPSGGSGRPIVVERKIPEYVPLKQSNIRISQKNALQKVGSESDQVVYGQGRLTLPIDPTDNLVKFTVYQANPLDSTKQDRVNLNNNSEFKLVFGSTTDFVFATVTNTTLTSPSRGEICFRIPKEKAKSLLETTDEQFHISIVSKTDGTETMLYTGKWTSSVNYSGVISAAEDAATALLNNATIASLQKQVTELTVKNETLTESLKKKSEESIAIQKAITINTAASTQVRPSQTSSGLSPSSI